MNSTKIEKIKIALSNKYLEWVEKLPEFRGGQIADLQTHRKFDREEAKKNWETTKPLAENELEFLSIRLIELFNVEDFEKLEAGLLKLFPKLLDPSRYRDFRATFQKQSEAIHGGRWNPIGYVFRSQEKRPIGMQVYTELPSLPPEVDYIKVELQHFLPSMIAVVFDVRLNDEANRQINRIQRELTFPNVRFHNILPWKLWRGHWSFPPAIVQRRKVIDWTRMLRNRVEACIKPYLRGHFLERGTGKSYELPALEIFILSGVPENKKDFGEWKDRSSAWLESYGIDLRFDFYQNESFLFVPSDSKDDEAWGRPTARLLVLTDHFLKDEKHKESKSREKDIVFYRLALGHLRALGLLTGILEFLESIQKDVQKLRKVTVNRMTSRSRLKSHLNFYGKILQVSTLLDRAEFEYEQQKALIVDETQILTEIQFSPGTFKTTSNLQLDTLQTIEYRINLIKRHLKYLQTSFSDYVGLQNIKSTNRLQWTVLWLSVIATVAAILSVIAGWPAIKQFLKDVFRIDLGN